MLRNKRVHIYEKKDDELDTSTLQRPLCLLKRMFIMKLTVREIVVH